MNKRKRREEKRRKKQWTTGKIPISFWLKTVLSFDQEIFEWKPLLGSEFSRNFFRIFLCFFFSYENASNVVANSFARISCVFANNSFDSTVSPGSTNSSKAVICLFNVSTFFWKRSNFFRSSPSSVSNARVFVCSSLWRRGREKNVDGEKKK